MAVWVTFYYGLMEGLRDYKEHKNKEEAEKYFRATYRNYFSLDTGLRNLSHLTPMDILIENIM